MVDINSEELFRNGRAHGLAAQLLLDASFRYADENQIEDAEKFAFNGTFSLSVHYLLGLCAELMIKAAYARCSGNADAEFLRRELGHDLVIAYDVALEAGFTPDVENLRDILVYMREPYLKHFFRYGNPSEFPLPDVPVVLQAYTLLDDQLREMFGWD